MKEREVMTAKEMFEELDLYAFHYEDEIWGNILEYSNSIELVTFKFYLDRKHFEVKTKYDVGSHMISMKELKAINKLIEELQW